MCTLEIVHRARYECCEPVSLGEHRLMFRPRDSHGLRLLHTGLVIEPASTMRWIHGPFGNSIAIASFEGTTQVIPPIEEFARPLPSPLTSQKYSG